MFEKSSKLKLRYSTDRGLINTEDLWDLPLLPSLDNLAKDLNRELKESEEESFVVQKNTVNEIIELKFSIVKHIIKSKLEENTRVENEVAKKLQKEKILSIIASKEDEELKDKSTGDLKKLLEDL